ncbi:MAG: cytochrome c [Alcaligenaceae bacterium]|nr:cytochrome c [Alcaligenaceae bacterium]
MKSPTIKPVAAVGLALAFACGPSGAADLMAGQAAFEKFACAACHGADGKSSVLPTYPVLAGQHADYLQHALRSYQRGASGSGAVNTRSNAVMTALVPQLSDADIRNIAAWLSSLPSDLAVRR